MRKTIITMLLGLITISLSAQNGEFIGGDISLLPDYENSKTKYLDGAGNLIPDLIPWLIKDCGWNTFRVRLFVNPKEPDPKNVSGVVQDLNYVTTLGKRIKDAGGRFMLDFHYSDTWADPSHQELPSAWKDCTTSAQKAERVYTYTKEQLQHLVAAGATPDFVQVGNEISYGMVGISVKPYEHSGDDWAGLLDVLAKGCKAVREVCPQAKIIIHTERSGKPDDTEFYYKKLQDLDYDIIGLSYYPFYHGVLQNLRTTLTRLYSVFPGKDVHIVETAYPIQWWPEDATIDTRSTWPVKEGSCDGQYKYTTDLIGLLKDFKNVKGLMWWFPEEAGNGDNADWNTMSGVVISGWLNRGLWWPTVNGNGHWPLKVGDTGVLWTLRNFLSPEASGIENITIGDADSSCSDEADGSGNNNRIYNVQGQYVGTSLENLPKGLYIIHNKKILR